MTRKPRVVSHAPYETCKPRALSNGNAPKTSAKSNLPAKQENLTLNDWMTVFAYVDKHPGMPQGQIVHHLRTLQTGALIFNQSTLSRKLKTRCELEQRVNDHPNALSGKRPRVVTSPHVERALVLWVKHMEEKGEVVNGPMLITKRAMFEERFGIPEKERLKGDGWVGSFRQAYGLKEHRRHGEAGSVDLSNVAKERKRVAEILAKFAPQDCFNFDETALFAFAPPDRGLAAKPMAGKKTDKFRITLGLACNSDGSEKLPPVFIGRSQKPICFKRKSPTTEGFIYYNNKKAWMTMDISQDWVKNIDRRFCDQRRSICMLIDNFSGHSISYVPTNIQLIFFEPNLTSFVQPCDAGIICCFKAHYRRSFCLQAIEKDDAGSQDIYKINLREAMMMVNEAWAAVTKDTIAHCWRHTGILP
ncbi:hypothetical protein M422DRAFT_191970, partial [Sphaerobolus stellatus SS14]